MSLAPVCYYCNTTAQCQTDVTANETSRSAAAQPSRAVSGVYGVTQGPPSIAAIRPAVRGCVSSKVVSWHGRRVCACVRADQRAKGAFFFFLSLAKNLFNRGCIRVFESSYRPQRAKKSGIRNTRFCRLMLASHREHFHLFA